MTVPSGAVNVRVHVLPLGVAVTEYGLQCPWLAATGSMPYCVMRSSWYGGSTSSSVPAAPCVGCSRSRYSTSIQLFIIWMRNYNKVLRYQQAVRVATQYASAPQQVDNIFVFIRQVALVPACWLSKTSAKSWPLTFWPWNRCPGHMWRGLPLCQF